MKKVIVHTIRMADVEDPEIYIADPIYQWQQSEEGRWIMEHSVKPPIWRKTLDHCNHYFLYDIVAWLEDRDYTYWKLKYE